MKGPALRAAPLTKPGNHAALRAVPLTSSLTSADIIIAQLTASLAQMPAHAERGRSTNPDPDDVTLDA